MRAQMRQKNIEQTIRIEFLACFSCCSFHENHCLLVTIIINEIIVLVESISVGVMMYVSEIFKVL